MDFYQSISNLQSNQTLKLERKIYHIYLEDVFEVKGIYLSNTCSYEEKPEGNVFTPIYVKDKENITIDGNGAKLILHGHITHFLFINCKNIVLKNIKFDYAHPTMSEFTIKSKKEGTYIIEIQKDTLFSIKNNDLIFHSEKNRKGKYYWQYSYRDYMNIALFRDNKTLINKTRWRDPECRFPCIPKFKTIKKISNKELEVTLENPEAFFEVDNTVQVRPTVRDQIGGAFLFSKDIRMEKCTYNAIHGFGILAEMCENISYIKNTIVPKKGRTIASNADFFHYCCCRGNILVEKNVLAEGHDDFVNVHGIPFKIINKSDKKITVRFMNNYAFGFDPFENGDQLELIKPSNLKTTKTNCFVKSHKLISLYEIELEIDGDTSKLKEGYFVNDINNNPTIIIKDNKFGPSMGRGILVTSSKKTVIKNNEFYRLGMTVLYLCYDCNFWFESGWCGNVVFKNNVIKNCCYNAFGNNISPVINSDPQVLKNKNPKYTVHKKLVVENNVFTGEDKYIFKAQYIKDFTLINNRFSTKYEKEEINSSIKDINNKLVTNMIIFGDSIAYGQGGKNFYGWAKMVQKDSRFSIVNHSICGYAALNFKDNFEEKLKASIKENHENVLVLALGMNDSLLMNGKEYEPLDLYKSYFNKFVDVAKKYVNRIVIIEITPVDEKRTTPINWSDQNIFYLNERIEKYNETLKSIASDRGIEFIETNKYLNSSLLFDGVHPSPKGHQILANIIKNYFK